MSFREKREISSYCLLVISNPAGAGRNLSSLFSRTATPEKRYLLKGNKISLSLKRNRNDSTYCYGNNDFQKIHHAVIIPNLNRMRLMA
jgi:hypothetical protein